MFIYIAGGKSTISENLLLKLHDIYTKPFPEETKDYNISMKSNRICEFWLNLQKANQH